MREGKRPIKAVTFDLWETLLYEKDGASQKRAEVRSKNLARALNSFGVQVSAKTVSEGISKAVSSFLGSWEANRDIGCIDQIRLIIENVSEGSLSLREEWEEELVSAYAASILEVPPRLNPDARGVLEELRQRGLLVGLICNTGLTPGVGLREFLFDEEVAGYFELMLFLEEIGIRKPDPEIFRLSAQGLGVAPSEIVHVGDNLKTDVWGAKKAGFRAIQFTSEEGRDRIAESDPSSLVSLSRRLGSLEDYKIVPDREIFSLPMLVKAIEELERV